MADVTAKLASRGQAHQRVHVGAVDVDATAVGMHDLTQPLDLCFEHAVRAGVGDHDGSQSIGIRLTPRLQVGEIDVAIRIAAHHDHVHARHLRAGRIRAVGGGRDQAEIAVSLPPGSLPGPNREQARILSLAPRVGLEADAGVARGLAEPGDQLPLEDRIAFPLLDRCEGMDLGELGPGDRDHLARGIELHRAAAQRDHAAIEGEIAIGQLAEVAEHRRLTAMGMEDGVREKR